MISEGAFRPVTLWSYHLSAQPLHVFGQPHITEVLPDVHREPPVLQMVFLLCSSFQSPEHQKLNSFTTKFEIICIETHFSQMPNIHFWPPWHCYSTGDNTILLEVKTIFFFLLSYVVLPHSKFVNSVSHIKNDIREMSPSKLLLTFVAQCIIKTFVKMQKS